MNCTLAPSRPSTCRSEEWSPDGYARFLVGPEFLQPIQHQPAHLADLRIFRGEQGRISPQHRPALGAQHAAQITEIAVDGFQVGIPAAEQRLNVPISMLELALEALDA